MAVRTGPKETFFSAATVGAASSPSPAASSSMSSGKVASSSTAAATSSSSASPSSSAAAPSSSTTLMATLSSLPTAFHLDTKRTVIVLIVATAVPFLLASSLLEVTSFSSPRQAFPLVIAILSARGHFKFRDAIRDTWLADLSRNSSLKNRVLVKFVVGERGCPWPPLDRVKNCLPRLDRSLRRKYRHRTHYAFHSLLENNGVNIIHEAVSSPPTPNSRIRGVFCSSTQLFVQIDIHVLENLAVDQIGTPDLGYATRVTLFDHSTGASIFTVITSESRNRQNLRETSEEATATTATIATTAASQPLGFAYVPIAPLTLPAGFRGYFLVSITGRDEAGARVETTRKDGEENEEGELDEEDPEDEVCVSWKPHSTQNGDHRYSLNNAGGRLFYFPRVIFRRDADGFDEAATNIPFDAATTDAAFVSFGFRLSGMKEEKEEEEEEEEEGGDAWEEEETAAAAELDWATRNEQEDRELAKEAADFGDIIFADVMDTYDNLPTKLLLAMKALHDNFDFDFLVKVDDDVFLRVDALFDLGRDYGLFGNGGGDVNDNLDVVTKATYLGRFRRDWAVMRAGKWAEARYQGNGYPPFACGATYGLSVAAVSWLTANVASLGRYQGEDVSMGFWMAALGADLIDDVRFACGGDYGGDDNYGVGGVNSAQLSAEEIRREHKLRRASSELKAKLLKAKGPS